jgi:phosphatidylglycerophosphatase A
MAKATLPADLPFWHPAVWLSTWFGSGLLPVAPGTWGFLLFRLFDIVKPWPVRLVERRFAGGLGIMGDDVAAAIYAGIFAYVLFNIETLT